MEAEQARTRSEADHRKTAANYNSCISHMRQLEKKLKRSINKSRLVPLFPFLLPLLGPRVLCVSVAACVWDRVSMFMSFDAVQMFHGLVRCAGVCSPCKRQGMWRLTEECYSSSSFLQWRLCFSSLILCFSSLSPPVGHISNWKPSIICSLRYVCIQALNKFRLKDLNNISTPVRRQ